MKASIDRSGKLMITPETDADAGYIRNLTKLIKKHCEHKGAENMLQSFKEENLLELKIIMEKSE
tara:strand:- start:203 stop:394 length:192 start_codon:yes stop_codon:yes gene_type:complete